MRSGALAKPLNKLGVVVALLCLAAVAGCGTSGTSQTPGQDTSSPASDPSNGGSNMATDVTVTRSGGIAGVNQRLVISADGSWVYTDQKAASEERGQLTPGQVQQLLEIMANPAFAAEAARPPAQGQCADAFNYTLASAVFTMQYEDCGTSPDHPLTQQVLRLLIDSTPL